MATPFGAGAGAGAAADPAGGSPCRSPMTSMIVVKILAPFGYADGSLGFTIPVNR